MKTENKQPKKIGRPRVFKEPMTNAERQQRYRYRVKREAHDMLQKLKESQQ